MLERAKSNFKNELLGNKMVKGTLTTILTIFYHSNHGFLKFR